MPPSLRSCWIWRPWSSTACLKICAARPGQGGDPRYFSTLSGNLLNNLSAGDYRFLSVEETPEGATAHMRLIPPDGGLNYHRLTIGRNAGQQPVAVDVYVYVTGEPLSHTLGRMVGQLSGGSEADSLAVAQGMQRASSALQAGKPATAKAILSALRLVGRNKKASCKCASWQQTAWPRKNCRPASRSAMRTVEPSKLSDHVSQGG